MAQDGNPDDTTLIAALNTDRTDAWRELARLDQEIRDRPHADDDCVWSTQYPQYGARVEAACRLLAEVGAVTPLYHWNKRRPPALDDNGAVSPADAIRLATAIVRSERFGYGSIEGAMSSGLLQAVVAALATWHQEQTG
jgi:hypothetical protein